jgi:alginate O-acetyltransferase complex protein AlgJ
MAAATSRKPWTSAALIGLFFAALWTPLIGTFFGAGNFRPGEENRILAGFPSRADGTNWFDFARAFTAYFDDHFGFRGTLITSQAILRVKLLGVSTSPDVLIGKEGWLYYTGEKSMEDYRGALPFATGELEAWLRYFKGYNAWLARRGILFLVVIVPDKQTVYPEFLPGSIRKVGARTRLDDFIAAMKTESNVCVLDLRSPLQAAKVRYSEVYHRTDTHWSDAGVYAAYREILPQIQRKYPSVRPLPYIEPLRSGDYRAGDVAKMLGLGRVWKEVPQQRASSLVYTEMPEGDLHVRGSGPTGSRLATFGDSFLLPLVDYLAPHFDETIASRFAELKPALIEQFHPDIVLFEMVERKLNVPITGIQEIQ